MAVSIQKLHGVHYNKLKVEQSTGLITLSCSFWYQVTQHQEFSALVRIGTTGLKSASTSRSAYHQSILAVHIQVILAARPGGFFYLLRSPLSSINPFQFYSFLSAENTNNGYLLNRSNKISGCIGNIGS